jgi:ribosomal protein S12 methylthiotransferase
MRRPANQEKVLGRIAKWREICPDLTIRSTFIVGFPGETEQEFDEMLDWLHEAELDRVGCFKYEPVEGATANEIAEHVEEDEKQDRFDRFMEAQRQISERRMANKVGRTLPVLIDEVDEDGATGRSPADAPEIDGNVYLDSETKLKPGDLVQAKIDGADEYDLWGSVVR